MDVFPSYINKKNCVDYASRLVDSFISCRLIDHADWPYSISSHFISRITCEIDGTIWILRVRDFLTSSNEQSIYISDIVRCIANCFITSRRNNNFLFDEIPQLSTNRNEIILKLKRPIFDLPTLLTQVKVTTTRKSNVKPFGLYDIQSVVDSKLLTLTQNEIGASFWPEGPDSIIFSVSKSPYQGVKLFERSLIDVTCNPNLPIDLLSAYHSSDSLKYSEMLMGGVLLFTNSKFSSNAAEEIRKSISTAINRDAIADSLMETVTPFNGFMDFWSPTASTQETSKPMKGAVREVSIGFADFEPNAKVVEKIAEDLSSSLNIKVNAVALSYRDYISNLDRTHCDMIYSLIQPRCDEPTIFLSSIVSLSKDKNWKTKIMNMLRKTQSINSLPERIKSCVEVSKQIAATMPCVPIVRVMSKCLVSPNASCLHLTREGLFIPQTRGNYVDDN